MTGGSTNTLRRRLLLAFGLIASVCAVAIGYYVVQARQHVGADYTAMVADVVRSQQDPAHLRSALQGMDSTHEHHRNELGELLLRIPRRTQNIRLQVLRSDLAPRRYGPMLEELDLTEELAATMLARFQQANRDGLDDAELAELREMGQELEAGLAWSYSELNHLVQKASADQRRIMGWLTLAVAWLLVMVVLAVGAVMLMMLRLQRQRDAMHHQSHTDMLTGLFNRRRLQQVADQEFARRQRQETPLSLLLLDLDHFKRINDAYGHPVGDEVLASFALTLQRQVRRLDTVARMGGEEFAVLLPDTDGVAARRLAERILEATRRMPLPDVIERQRLTVSIGMSEARQSDGFEHLYTRADRRLYAAKQAGRDRVVGSDVVSDASPRGHASSDAEPEAPRQQNAR